MDRGNRDLDRMAVTATLHCLTGCAIGEVLGLVVGPVNRAMIARGRGHAVVHAHH